jgi:creatine kinase
VIRDYHSISGELKHVNCWDLSKVEGLPEGGLCLKALGLGDTSMRVRVGRNLKDFPLPGNMTQEDRVTLEARMIGAFEKLMADPAYGGTYHTLTPDLKYSIDQVVYQQLVDDHVMFKDMSVDPYLKSAGISGHWPFGRGVYVSEDKGFIVWVGEEDHLRIMCMKTGTSLNDVFDRLQVCLKMMESQEGCEFAISPDYGYVTSCPTNLGSGMRASLHIKLPCLTKKGKDVSEAKACAKTLGLSVRGVGGEHTEAGEDGTVDISPSARLCIKESEIVAALYKGIKLLMEKEKAAEAAMGDAHAMPDCPELKIIADIKVSHPENRMAKHFCNKFFSSLPEDKQKLLLLCCKSGYENSDSGMGLYAMSPTDYDEFKEYFDKVRTPNRPIPYLRMQREVLRVLLFTAFQNRVSWSMKPLRSY